MVNEVISSATSVNTTQTVAARVAAPIPPAPAVKESAPSATSRQTDATSGTELPVQNIESSKKDAPEDLASVMKRMQDYVESYDRDLHFSLDEESGRTVIKVIDPETEELVRQIPGEEALEVARILEKNGGLMPESMA